MISYIDILLYSIKSGRFKILINDFRPLSVYCYETIALEIHSPCTKIGCNMLLVIFVIIQIVSFIFSYFFAYLSRYGYLLIFPKYE